MESGCFGTSFGGVWPLLKWSSIDRKCTPGREEVGAWPQLTQLVTIASFGGHFEGFMGIFFFHKCSFMIKKIHF